MSIDGEEFEGEDIKEALLSYKEYIEEFPSDNEEIGECCQEEIIADILDDFREEDTSGKTYMVLSKLLHQNFNQNIKEVLTNSQAREEFLQQLDQLIEATKEQ